MKMKKKEEKDRFSKLMSLRSLTSQSKTSDKDIVEISQKIKAGVSKRHEEKTS